MDSLHTDPLDKVLLQKDLLHKELLQTELFQKKLVLNGLNVPSEIIRIIKDYTFMDTTMSKAKKNKNKLSHLIGTTKWCGKNVHKTKIKDLRYFGLRKLFAVLNFK